jgi:hypothetical protein
MWRGSARCCGRCEGLRRMSVPSRVVLLKGVGSVGQSTTARALQAITRDPLCMSPWTLSWTCCPHTLCKPAWPSTDGLLPPLPRPLPQGEGGRAFLPPSPCERGGAGGDVSQSSRRLVLPAIRTGSCSRPSTTGANRRSWFAPGRPWNGRWRRDNGDDGADRASDSQGLRSVRGGTRLERRGTVGGHVSREHDRVRAVFAASSASHLFGERRRDGGLKPQPARLGGREGRSPPNIGFLWYLECRDAGWVGETPPIGSMRVDG